MATDAENVKIELKAQMRSGGHGIQRQHINEGGSPANWTDPN